MVEIAFSRVLVLQRVDSLAKNRSRRKHVWKMRTRVGFDWNEGPNTAIRLLLIYLMHKRNLRKRRCSLLIDATTKGGRESFFKAQRWTTIQPEGEDHRRVWHDGSVRHSEWHGNTLDHRRVPIHRQIMNRWCLVERPTARPTDPLSGGDDRFVPVETTKRQNHSSDHLVNDRPTRFSSSGAFSRITWAPYTPRQIANVPDRPAQRTKFRDAGARIGPAMIDLAGITGAGGGGAAGNGLILHQIIGNVPFCLSLLIILALTRPTLAYYPSIEQYLE